MNIIDIFPECDQQNNYWLKQAFDIIKYRQQNPLKYISHKDRRPSDYIYCHEHHIIPKHVYKHLNKSIDNSKQNLVTVSVEEHVKLHYFYAKYFLERSENEHNELWHFLAFANACAVNFALNTNIFLITESQFQTILSETNLIKRNTSSVYNKALWQNPDFRKRALAAWKKAMTKEVKEKAVKAIRAAFKSGRVDIESISRHSRERWKDEAYKNKTVMARKKYDLEHPESRVNAGKAISKTLNSDPQKLKERNIKTSNAIKKAWAKLSAEERKTRINKISFKKYKYFIINSDGSIVKILPSAKALLKYLNDNGIKNCKNENIKLKTLNEMIRRYLIGQIKSVYGLQLKREMHNCSIAEERS